MPPERDNIKQTISPERLQGYKNRIAYKFGQCSEIDTLVYYNWNTALSESLYCSLQTLEISLRNTIHNNASVHFNNRNWFDDPAILDRRTREFVSTAKSVLKSQNKNLSPGRILAELSFGFWTSLFNKKYDQMLWHKIIKTTFPFMQARIRTRATLSKRLNQIRKLRNRIFHYEPIWYYNDLEKQHEQIIETIGWIEPAIKDMINPIDHFGACMSQDRIKSIRDELQKMFGH